MKNPKILGPDHYDRWYTHPDLSEQWHNVDSVRSLYFAVLSNIYTGDRVLDAGCGDGVLGFKLHDVDYVGVDWSKVAIDKARKLDKDHEYEVMNIHSSEFWNLMQSYRPTVVVSLQTFEHMEKDVEVAEKMLKMTDRILFSVPAAEIKRNGELHLGHIREYTLESLVNRFGKFANVTIHSYGFTHERFLVELTKTFGPNMAFIKIPFERDKFTEHIIDSMSTLDAL